MIVLRVLWIGHGVQFWNGHAGKTVELGNDQRIAGPHGSDGLIQSGAITVGADTQAMSAHLAEIAKTVASGAHALLILDGAGWHGSAELEVPDNITLLKLPPYSPELNPMENVWAYLRANKLAISVFDNYEQIVDRCCEAWNFFANDKTAITSITTRQWAKTVND